MLIFRFESWILELICHLNICYLVLSLTTLFGLGLAYAAIFFCRLCLSTLNGRGIFPSQLLLLISMLLASGKEFVLILFLPSQQVI
jgi:hypothetical protein